MTERDYTEQAASTMQSLLEKYKTSMKMYINSYVSQPKQDFVVRAPEGRHQPSQSHVCQDIPIGIEREKDFFKNKISTYMQGRASYPICPNLRLYFRPTIVKDSQVNLLSEKRL